MRSFFCLAIVSTFLFGNLTWAGTENGSPKIELKWAIEHIPQKYFLIAAKVMSESLRAEIGDKITVNVNPAPTNSRADQRAARGKLLEMLKTQQTGIAQVYTQAFVKLDKTLEILDLPYLFRNHDHVSKVINGPIGKKIMDRLAAHGLKGLAITYSGGFQNFLSGKKLDFLAPATFKGLTGGNIYPPTDLALGYTSMNKVESIDKLLTENTAMELVGLGKIDFCLVTGADVDKFYKEYRGSKPLYIYDNEFNVLMTIITMNKTVFDSLPVDYQKAIQKSASAAARAERDTIISDAKATREQIDNESLTNQNIAFVKMSDAENKALKKAAMKAYDALSAEQMALVKEIQNVK